MRRSCFAILLLALLVLTGCRQTTSPTATNPLTPIGPLAPIGGAASGTGNGSTFGPLGAPTRVTPPGTGALSIPNNYMGGAVPIGQSAAQNPQFGGFAYSGPGLQSQVVGSGVESAGWTETNSNVQAAGGGYPPQGEPGLAAPSMSPRLGGMRVIDLTGAPPPPGYRGVAPIPSAPLQPLPPSTNLAPSLQRVNPTPGFRAIQSPSPGDFAGPENNLLSNPQSPVTIARAQTFPASPSPLDSNFRGSEQFRGGPSTDPVGSGGFGGQARDDLQWRAPAGRY